MYCPPGSRKIMGLFPAHSRFTRMYGVTHGIAFQAIRYFRNQIQMIKPDSLIRQSDFVMFLARLFFIIPFFLTLKKYKCGKNRMKM